MINVLFSVCLVLRHWFFYIDQGSIQTEYGYSQNIFSYFLIPVTASFGVQMWTQVKFPTNFTYAQSNLHVARTATIILLPILFLIANIGSIDFLKVFMFDIYEDKNKPRILILIPLLLSLLNGTYLRLYKLDIIAFCICVYLYLITSSFILHYFLIFEFVRIILFYSKHKTINFKIKYDWLIYLSLYFIVILLIQVLEIERINIFFEIILGISFVKLLHLFSMFINKYIFKNRFDSFKFSLLWFYIGQALCFSLIVKTLPMHILLIISKNMFFSFLLLCLIALSSYCISNSVVLILSRITKK
jgi:hypothetical protein